MVPISGSEMLDAEDNDYFDVASAMVYDGVFGHLGIHQDIPLIRFTKKWNHVTAFNESTIDQMRTIADKCRIDKYIGKYLKFPPSAEQPTDIPRPITFEGDYIPECDHLTLRSIALSDTNPCYSPYNVLVHCPRQ
jgi:carboxypeptidase D